MKMPEGQAPLIDRSTGDLGRGRGAFATPVDCAIHENCLADSGMNRHRCIGDNSANVESTDAVIRLVTHVLDAEGAGDLARDDRVLDRTPVHRGDAVDVIDAQTRVLERGEAGLAREFQSGATRRLGEFR
ncbi:hypothetical protein ACQPZ2_29855 [Nocardia pseudovaccinii]|uniref:hypothetical protein n=1 Tax=Nocardia pseudovaccinii TaxID=189540 RepID=UPI003D91DDA2